MFIDGLCTKCQNIRKINIQYQQRLDKVLSKFEFYKGDEYVYKNIISYYRNSNEFYISDDFPNLSLETIESLLKDLEENR